MDEDIHLLDLLRLNIVLGAKTLDLSGDLGIKIGGIELRDKTNPGNPLAYLLPHRVSTNPLREYEADTRDDYPLTQTITSILAMFPLVISGRGGENLLSKSSTGQRRWR
jgi:hypothetical protein